MTDLDDEVIGYLWRWATLALASGIAAGLLTALFLMIGLAPAAAPVLALGLVFPPMFIVIAKMRRRAGTGW